MFISFIKFLLGKSSKTLAECWVFKASDSGTEVTICGDPPHNDFKPL